MIKYEGLGIVVNDTLIISDIHIGYEEMLNKQGVLVPRSQFDKLKKRLENLLEKVKPKLVIINGDLKHEFGSISDQEWRDTLKFIDCITKDSKLILIKGNHDSIIGPIALKRGVEIKDHVMIDDVYVFHGQRIPEDEDFKKAKTIIIGHVHPVYTLEEGAKRETFKCFVKTKYKNKTLYITPSFHDLTEGTDVQSTDLLTPIIDDIKDMEITISQDGKLYDFGEIKRKK